MTKIDDEQFEVAIAANALFGEFRLFPDLVDGEAVWMLTTNHGFGGVGKTPSDALRDCIAQGRARGFRRFRPLPSDSHLAPLWLRRIGMRLRFAWCRMAHRSAWGPVERVENMPGGHLWFRECRRCPCVHGVKSA